MSPPAVFSIPPQLAFVDALASGILDRRSEDPLALARTVILLPTRRACRALADAFLRHSDGTASILPQMRPIGDVDEDELLLEAVDGPGLDPGADLPPAIPELRRRLLLAERLIAGAGDDLTAEQAAWLAAELGRFLDQVQTERLDFAGLKDLAPEDFAEHWQEVLDFLAILVGEWPAILEAEGAVDPAERRNRALAGLAERWRAKPPDHPVIAAGSTGSVPATADLLAVIAGLGLGEVVLPGLDRDLDEAAWKAVGESPSHPQYGLARLLPRLEVTRESVRDWPTPMRAENAGELAQRTRLLSAALAPPAATDGWRALDGASLKDALHKVTRIEAHNPREEAGAIALVMRQTLETPGKTAALVTPDRGLARRVAAALGQWDIAIDDSAGIPLSATAPASFLLHVGELVAGAWAPAPLLAVLKHPLAAGGLAPGAFRAAARALEIAVLRGPRPAGGIAGLRAVLAATQREQALGEWLDDLQARFAPFSRAMDRGKVPLTDLLQAHIEAAEALAESSEESGPARLWAGEAGEAMAGFVAELQLAGAGFPAIPPAQYPALLQALMAGRVVRPRFGRHPRLNIWGLLEARLQRADVMILGGLNEATWPAETQADPWMSRPMRASFGLPLPERRIGLTAHDFAQCFGAPEVVLTRALRIEGAPSVPSRWLLRLDAVLHALAGADPDEPTKEPAPTDFLLGRSLMLGWHRELHMPDPGEIKPIDPPAPRPPVPARPRRLSVTQIETLMRDPYALYARKILGLRALDPIDADPGAADRGLFIHKALEEFVRSHPGPGLPEDGLSKLLAFGRRALGASLALPGVWAFWWPRFERIAAWFLQCEEVRRHEIARSHVEVRGERALAAPGGDFLLTATADRIDERRDGSLAILDYKTGALPSTKEIAGGFAPQLPLEAAIAAGGGFEDVAAGAVAELAFWRLTGGDPPGKIKPLKDPGALAQEALDGLGAVIARFDDEATPYLARPRPGAAPRYSDYVHLERIAEWSVAAGEEDE